MYVQNGEAKTKINKIKERKDVRDFINNINDKDHMHGHGVYY